MFFQCPFQQLLSHSLPSPLKTHNILFLSYLWALPSHDLCRQDLSCIYLSPEHGDDITLMTFPSKSFLWQTSWGHTSPTSFIPLKVLMWWGLCLYYLRPVGGLAAFSYPVVPSSSTSATLPLTCSPPSWAGTAPFLLLFWGWLGGWIQLPVVYSELVCLASLWKGPPNWRKRTPRIRI